MNSSRLRKAFRYPGDDDEAYSNAPPEGIDEEEQEKIITKIATDDAKSIIFYRACFLSVPFLGLVYFALILFILPYPSGAASSAHPIFYCLSIISLILSLCIAYDIETPKAGVEARLLATDPSSEPPLAQILQTCRTRLASINAAVCSFISVLAMRSSGDSALAVPGVSMSFSVIPVLAVFAIVVVARHELRPVNVGALESMKYGYKGA